MKTAELDPKGTYVIGIHPHSVLPMGGITAVVDGQSEGCFPVSLFVFKKYA